MKNIKYFLLFVTALCVQRNNFGRQQQRGFGQDIQIKISMNQYKKFKILIHHN
jgi:glutamine amidotransferase PdxT